MPKFSLEKTINAKRESVFDVFSNYEDYEKLFSQHFPSIRVRSVRDNVAVVEEHMNFGNKELVIMAKHVSEKPITHQVFVIGGDIKGTQIKEEFIETSQGTKVLVDVDLKLKGKMKLSGLFGKNKFEEDYAKILDDFAKFAERLV